VDKKFWKMGIGTKLFEKSFEYLETVTPLITLPEECYKERSYRSLFKSKVKGIYRDNKVEYFFNEVKMKVVMSIRPKFVEKILNRIKVFELRKKIFKKEVESVIIYESSPTRKIVGEFIIDRIISDTPDKIYQKYNKYLGIDKENYFKYFKNTNIAYAIKIEKVIKYEKELALADFNLERAPQSYQYIYMNSLEFSIYYLCYHTLLVVCQIVLIKKFRLTLTELREFF